MAFRPAGYRRSIEKSLSQEREGSAFIDVTTAEDLGKFPDMNVASALQRMPGVVIPADGGVGRRGNIRDAAPPSVNADVFD
jgi:outer membrane cobalamin receptor